MKHALGKTALIGLGIFAFTALPAHAGSLGTTSGGLGKPPTPTAAICTVANPCSPAFFGNAAFSVASGGCGLRNRGDCAIDISAAGHPALAAMVMWSVILPNGMSTSDPRVSTLFVTHGEAGANIAGQLIGTGADPCWLTNSTSTPIAAYLAFIPLSVVDSEVNPTQGNGNYHVFLEPGGSGLTSGESPWDGNVVPPLFEGASIVIFGTGTQKVAIWGGPGFTGATFAGGSQSYALQFAPIAAPTGGVADFVSLFADRQVGVSDYTFESSLSAKSMIINGITVAGIGGSINPTSGLNVDPAAPLPRLWDTNEIDVGSMGVFSSSPGPGVMSIRVGGPSSTDCITPIAHVLAYN